MGQIPHVKEVLPSNTPELSDTAWADALGLHGNERDQVLKRLEQIRGLGGKPAPAPVPAKPPEKPHAAPEHPKPDHRADQHSHEHKHEQPHQGPQFQHGQQKPRN